MPSLWTVYFYGAIGHRAHEIRASGLTPVLLHVGANSFVEDISYYGPLMWFLRQLKPRLIPCEPQAQLIPRIAESVGMLKLPDEQVRIIDRAVDPDCPGEKGMSMYTWSERFRELVPPSVVLDGYVSSARHHLPAAAGGAAKDPSNLDREHFARVAKLPNLTDYVEEFFLPCITVQELLARGGFRPQEIASIIIDAEGRDNAILGAFLAMEGFQPAFIMHETVVGDPGFCRSPLMQQVPSLNPAFHGSIWERLRARGYAVGVTAGGANVVSVDQRLFRWPRWQGVLRLLSLLVPCDRGICVP